MIIKKHIIHVLLLLGIITPVYGQEKNEEVNLEGVEIGRMGDPAAVNPDEYEFSEAESELWLKDHLANVKQPVRIYYEFLKSGTYEEGFSDSVYLDILGINEDGSKSARLQFFTADRQQSATPDNLNDITGNPVLGIYMQGDVYEMNRLTSGSWRYFQRQIKFAFSRNARVEPVTFELDGKKIQGEKITITPYTNDPHRRQFTEFADKRYEFILSDDVPGTLYQIKTIVPDNSAPDKEPLIVETLTFKSAKT